MTYIMAVDQGTTSSRCIVFDREAHALHTAQQEFPQYFPHPGWVEHDPEEIWQSQLSVIQQVMADLNLQAADVTAIGITNQRETTVVWDRKTGEPIYNAIVWQDRRTADYCEKLKEQGLEAKIRRITGLLIDAYFSATKIAWILEHVPGARRKAESGELAFGTIDTWLIWKLTRGALHITDVSNASRTLLLNLDTRQWDEDLLSLFGIPATMLPEIRSSCEIYGKTVFPVQCAGIPIAACAGDQQAALFGQQCLGDGMAKCTYGTGAFLIANTGNRRVASSNGLLTTMAWKIGDQVTYALEGSVFICGALIHWLRDGLQLIEHASECEALAESVADNGGVLFVPALTGLGAPHWDPHARGAIFGITRGTTSGHIARAALEGICYQVNDLLQTMHSDIGTAIQQLRIDGGAAANNLLAQFQADISGVPIVRPSNLETTALGAASLAGIATGCWTLDELSGETLIDREFTPGMDSKEIERLTAQWSKAVARSRGW